MENPRPHVRWMIMRDIPEVLDIAHEVFEYPLSKQQLIKTLRERNTIGMVAEVNDYVRGYMIYELLRTRLDILSFAVAREHWRQGIGRAMVEKLINKLCPERRKKLVCHIRDSNYPAQMFFCKMGFRAVKIERNFYDGCEDDAYRFEYRIGQHAQARS